MKKTTGFPCPRCSVAMGVVRTRTRPAGLARKRRCPNPACGFVMTTREVDEPTAQRAMAALQRQSGISITNYAKAPLASYEFAQSDGKLKVEDSRS